MSRLAAESSPARQQLCLRLRGLLQDQLHVEVDGARTDLFATGLLDSLLFVELLLLLESEFGVRVSVEDLEIEDFRTVDRIAAFVEARAQGSGG